MFLEYRNRNIRMTPPTHVFPQVPNLYRIIPLEVLRKTPGVSFDLVPTDVLRRIDGIDRVLHDGGAVSPGPVGDIGRPWYMHLKQDDNLIVLHGVRYIDIYTREHGRIESFEAAPHQIRQDGKIIYDGPAMLVWPRGVFHRIRSDEKVGSASLNFAVRYEGFDIRTNFNVYDLNPATGEYRMIRAGYLDQPSG
jgi:hypothetical protein